MPFHPEALTRPALKSLAKALQKAAPEILGIPVAQHQAQELLARQLGYAHWHEAYAKAGQATPAPRHRSPSQPSAAPAEDGPGLTFRRLADEAQALYGFDLQQTRTLASSLYAEGLISYPMTRSGHLPTNLQADVPEVLATIARIRPADQARLATIQLDQEAAVWQPDQASHHDFYAIVPKATGRPVDLDIFEGQLYGLIANAYLNLVTRPGPGTPMTLPRLTPNPAWEKYRRDKNIQGKPGMYLDLNQPPLLAVLDGWFSAVALGALKGTHTRLRVALSSRGRLTVSSDGPDLPSQIQPGHPWEDSDLHGASTESSRPVQDLISRGLRSHPGWAMAALFLPQATLSFPIQGRLHDLHLEGGEWLSCAPGEVRDPEPVTHHLGAAELRRAPLFGVRLSADLSQAYPVGWYDKPQPWVSDAIFEHLQQWLAVYADVAPGLHVVFHGPNQTTRIFTRTSGAPVTAKKTHMWHAWCDRPSPHHDVATFVEAAVQRGDQALLDTWAHGAFGYLRAILKEHQPRRRRPR